MLIAPPWLPVPPPAYGGTEAVVAVLGRGLAERGHDVSVVAVGHSQVPGARCMETLDRPPDSIGATEPEWDHLLRAVDLIRRAQPDIVIDHSGPLGAMLVPGGGRPSLHVVHDRLDGVIGAAYGEVARQRRRLRLVALTEAQRHSAAHLPFTGVCHNGLVMDDAPFGRTGRGYLLFVGRMSADKGPDAAIDIAHAAGRPLVIAAKCSEPAEKRYFDEEIAPRLGPGVHWLGEVDAALRFRLMAGADALLFPIRWPEPFGMVMIEAMACGTPVLATRHGSTPEVVADGDTGFVRDDPMELVECVPLAAALDRRACRAHVATHFSHARVAEAYERLALEVLHA